MLQRLQSIFLLLCGLAFLGLLKLPFASSTQEMSPIFEDKVFNIHDHVILLILAIGGGVIALINIFMFNNRLLQKRIGFFLIIFSIFIPLVAVWLIFIQNKITSSAVGLDDGLGIYLPIISLVCAILANRFIAKDENLVKSMDRLR